MLRRDHKPGCETPPANGRDRRTLGLTLDHEGSRPVLVPAWLFTVKGAADAEPLAQIAVDPKYLAPPVPPGGVPSGVNTASPNAVPPGPPTGMPAPGSTTPTAKPPASATTAPR